MESEYGNGGGEIVMPISKYDRHFGGKGGAAKALRAMKEKYGEEKGEQVFYATKNKKKRVLSAASKAIKRK